MVQQGKIKENRKEKEKLELMCQLVITTLLETITWICMHTKYHCTPKSMNYFWDKERELTGEAEFFSIKRLTTEVAISDLQNVNCKSSQYKLKDFNG